jgi:hypothetical protein
MLYFCTKKNLASEQRLQVTEIKHHNLMIGGNSAPTMNRALLEKRFIRTPAYQYWYRLVTVADTNNGWLTSRYQ